MRVHREAQPLADRHGCLGAPSSDNRWFAGRSRNRRSSVNFLGRVNVTQSRGARFAILCLPMTNAEQDALRAARPRVAVWIDKLRHASHVVFVPERTRHTQTIPNSGSIP